jgi:hypothetical protein
MADKEIKTVPTWGYSKDGAQIFELKEGEKLPSGFYDHPDKVKDDEIPAKRRNAE